MKRRASLTEADLAEWAAYVRHVLPMAGRTRPDPPPPVPPLSAPQAVLPAPLPPRPPPPALAPLVIGRQPAGVDNATWARLQGGKLPVARTLDLHGRTAERAFHTLVAFLHRAHADRLRCVEVITGRGSGETGGVLRREFPLWLNLAELRGLVLAAAHPHPGNVGSVRLLLRRPR